MYKIYGYDDYYIDKGGYHRVTLASNATNVAIHRLVYLVWGPEELQSDMVVHHKDHNKWNNSIYNLEQTTAALNSREAAENGLYKSNLHWTSDIVRDCCEKMTQGMKYDEIAALYGIYKSSDPKLYKNFYSSLEKFQQKAIWKDIVEDYDLENYVGRVNKIYSDKDVLEMHRMYQNGFSIEEIMRKFNIKRALLQNYLSYRKRPHLRNYEGSTTIERVA